MKKRQQQKNENMYMYHLETTIKEKSKHINVIVTRYYKIDIYKNQLHLV